MESIEIVIPEGMDDTNTKPHLGRPVGNGPRSYRADPAVVRSKIYSTLGQRLPSLEECRREIDTYNAMLLGRVDIPSINGVTDLMEFATAVLSRLNEIEGLIERAENDCTPGYGRGSPMQKFRTGELRAAQDTAKRQVDLGSRRLSYAQMVESMRYQP